MVRRPPSLLVVSNKRYATDFRKYLMQAAERAGGRSMHVYCGDRVVVSQDGGERCFFPPDVSEAALLPLVRDGLGEGPLIALTGLGCNEASAANALQRSLPDGIFVYDVYDDLMFGATGTERLDRMRLDALWRSRCPQAIVLDGALRDRYPDAHHIDNASHLRPIAAVAQADPCRIVYIGSIDDRVDFAWLDALAGQDVTIGVYGRLHEHATRAPAELDDLLRRRSNVEFRGGYDNDDLWEILARYRVGVVPYHVDHPMTRHVNPDKLFHCLNAGLEVLAPPFPQARRHARHIHLVETEGPWATVLAAVVNAPRGGTWSARDNGWDRRWSQLLRAVLG